MISGWKIILAMFLMAVVVYSCGYMDGATNFYGFG